MTEEDVSFDAMDSFPDLKCAVIAGRNDPGRVRAYRKPFYIGSVPAE